MPQRSSCACQRKHERIVRNVAPNRLWVRRRSSDAVDRGVNRREAHRDPLWEGDGDSRELCAHASIGTGVERDRGPANSRVVAKTYRCRILEAIAGVQGQRWRLGQRSNGVME